MIKNFISRNDEINSYIRSGKGIELIGSGLLTSDEQTQLINYLALKRCGEKKIEETISVSFPNVTVKYKL